MTPRLLLGFAACLIAGLALGSWLARWEAPGAAHDAGARRAEAAPGTGPEAAPEPPAPSPTASEPREPELGPLPIVFSGVDPPEPGSLCDSEWRGLEAFVAEIKEGEVRVHERFASIPSGTRAGLASWMSRCTQDGAPVRITSAQTGALIAVYDPRTGLRPN